MRIAIGQIQVESNTFVLQKADLSYFRSTHLLYGDEITGRLGGTHAEVGGFLDILGGAGAEIVPTVAAHSVSSGVVPRETFETLQSELLARLAAEASIDGVLLALHGSMVVEGDHDGEGALLASVRELVGPNLPLVATLDLHANVTEQMVKHATALVGYDTYPHVDLYETAVRGARLLLSAVRGEADPVAVFAKAPMIVPAEGMSTRDGPMADLLADAKRVERKPGILSTSLFAVQPWLDVYDTGFSAVVIADGPARAPDAEMEARALATRAWELRRRFDAPLLDVDDAIHRALATDGGPIILSESADGISAGSPGDSVAVLERLLALRVAERCLVCVVDPPAVASAIGAGVGSEITVPVGGTLDPRYSAPVVITGRVRLLSDGRFVFLGTEFTGTETSMGPAAVIEVGSISVLVMGRPVFTIDPSFYRSVGLEPRDAKIVVVKSALQFRDNYGPFARAMWVVDTPGPSTANFARLEWQNVQRPLFPFDDDFVPEIKSAVGMGGVETAGT